MKYIGSKVLAAFSLSCILACSPYKSVTPTLNQDGLPPECDGLVALVKEHWKQHKKLNYFEYNEGFLTSIQMEYHGCMLHKFTEADIVKLLGKPTKRVAQGILYEVGEKCADPLKDGCHLFVWFFDDRTDLLMSFQVQNSAPHIHYKN